MKGRASSAPPVFQDTLFDATRVVQRLLKNGTSIRMKLEPLGEGRVKILEYSRKAQGGVWHRYIHSGGLVASAWVGGARHGWPSRQ